MACRGVFFALTREEKEALLRAPDSDTVIEIITEEIEERWDEDWLQQMDKSWDAVHRCLGNGTLAVSQSAASAKAILGGQHLSSRPDWIVSYLAVSMVPKVAEALEPFTEAEFRRRYFALRKKFLWFDFTDYDGPIDEGDFDYTWSYFEEMRQFFRKAAEAKRAVIFAVDQ